MSCLAQSTAAAPPAPKVVWKAESGSFSPFVSQYASNFAVFADGVLRLDNDDPKRPGALCAYNDDAVFRAGKGVLVVEWQVRPGKPARAEDHSFQMVIQPVAGDGMVYLGAFKFSPGLVATPWGEVTTEKDKFLDCRALIDLANGQALFEIDGKTVADGQLGKLKNRPYLFFGDGSAHISGKAELKQITIGCK